MAGSRSMEKTTRSIGDSAVDGLFSGAVAGILMAVYLVIAGLLKGEDPGTVLGRFTPSGDGSPLLGAAAHLAVSAVYGAIFALILGQIGRLRPSLLRFSWLLGAAYGISLWLAAEFIILPAAGSPLHLIPPIHFALSHLVFGLTLGVAIGWVNRSR
jgi:hypothetical protein